jgi:hypothetical protein
MDAGQRRLHTAVVDAMAAAQKDGRLPPPNMTGDRGERPPPGR